MNQFKKITLGGGCFWKLQLLYQRMIGVSDTRTGYMGGHVDYPSYKLICTGATYHAEVVEVTYDPTQLKLQEILYEFFMIHDPTQKDRQGLDIGTQYRSCIFYLHEEDLKEIKAYIDNLQKDYPEEPIQTQVSKVERFWNAEEMHQRYLEKAGQSAEKGCDEIIMCYN